MEAVPKLPMISFELKTSTENTHFGPKLKQYIAEAYREDPDSYSNEIHQLESLRSAAVRPTSDAAGLSALNRYFCQLRAIQSRFPMAKGQPAACSFSWRDIHAKMNCSVADIRFEMACILYNIGALLTQLAASEPRNSSDSLKATCTKYQTAAWAFQYIREQYPQPPGVDVATEIMRLFQEICFAQAQECILDKSIQDTRKPSVVGAVATQVLYFYKNSLALLGTSTGTDNIHEVIGTKQYNYWHRYLSFKSFYIGCIVCLYQGMNAEEQQKMGERVAFYQQAIDKLAAARKLAKYIEPVQITEEALTFTNDVVEGKRKAAKNENEFIYHEEVPDKDLLVDMKPACLVKAIPINFNDPEISGPDIFSRLVPMGAHEASSMYSEEKAKLLRHIVAQADAKNMELIDFMSSLQLDQLEVLDDDQKIPQEIVDRCAAMNAKTEVIQSLVDSMNNLAEIISDVEHSLGEIKAMIQEETKKEKEFNQVMGHRPPSIVQTELSREFHKYQEAHARTNESNQVLHKAMTLHIANLKLLSQPLDVLQCKIPSIDNIEGLDRDTMTEMRRVVSKAREMQTQRDSLVQQLREAITADDITAQLLARSSEPADEIFKQEIEKHTPKIKIIEQNLAAQENIINRLTSLYASYGDSRRLLSDVLRKREGLINALITSYDTYEELLGKSQKGQEFYKKLSHNVNQLLVRLRSTCQVQEEERAQLLSKHNAKVPPPIPTTSASAKIPECPTPPSAGSGRKLKDYLPYMKNRMLASRLPPGQLEAVQPDSYYPESIYPTSIRPTPVGSEATDLTQMQLPDGVAVPPGMQYPNNPYNRYNSPYTPNENEPYSAVDYGYPMKNAFEKPEESHYGYNTSYTPPQFSTQVQDPQTYANPYYSATHNNTTIVTDSQNSMPYGNIGQANLNPNTPQYNPYDYNTNQVAPTPEPVPTMSAYNVHNQDMSANFAQMHVSAPKSDPNYKGDYSQTYYSIQYPQTSTPNMATYSNAPQNSNTNMTSSQNPSDYHSLNYPYSSDSQYVPQSNPNTSSAYSIADQYNSTKYNYTSQSYPIYTNSESTVTSTASAFNNTANMANYPGSMANNPTPIASSMTNMPTNTANNSSDMVQNPGNINNPAYMVNNPGYIVNNPVDMTNNPAYMPNNPADVTNVPAHTANVPPYMANNPADMSNNLAYMANNPANIANQPGSMNNPISIIDNSNNVNIPSSLANIPEMSMPNVVQPFNPIPQDGSYIDPNVLSQLDAIDRPIKSHVTGEALSTNLTFQPSYQPYPSSTVSYNPTEQNIQPNSTVSYNPIEQSTQPGSTVSYNPIEQSTQPGSTVTYNPTEQSTQPGSTVSYNPTEQSTQPVSNYQFQDQSGNVNYYQNQNHPGYNYNSVSGTYEYSYGSQNSYTSYANNEQSNMNPQTINQDTNWSAPGVYTSAGKNDTVQSPSENQPMMQNAAQPDNQTYYNVPYGYQTTIQSNEDVPESEPESTNYGASMNQSTYMQSGQDRDTSVTFSNNQVTTPKEEMAQPSFDQNQNNQIESVTTESPKPIENIEVENKPEINTEPSVFDLLSDIDFTVVQKPLQPEIKVPQVSESAIKKPTFVPKPQPVVKPVIKEEVLERPAKMDLFSDPSLLNKFTQEVKNLQKLVDSLTNKTPSGLTLLDSKWKKFQDVQAKENMTRSKTIAMQHCSGNIVTEVVPFDDSRLTLKSDPDTYINASYYPQLASWCIPLVISKNPAEEECDVFWKAVLEYKIACVVCLLSEIEMQGKSYWPTAKGQSLDLAGGLKVILDEVTCNVHWTERKLTVACGKTVLNVIHYQINVFPAKIVCSPLVLLADKLLGQTYAGRLSNQLCGAWLQCGAGAGRSALLALLLMTMCQVRAGQMQLCDMLDAASTNLVKHRTNILEDTKYLADAYRTALFYVQGVLCSGTTMFNGEAVSVPSGAAVLPPVTPTPTVATSSSQKTQKFSRESFEEMKQSPGLKSGDMKDPLNFLDPLWSLKKK